MKTLRAPITSASVSASTPLATARPSLGVLLVAALGVGSGACMISAEADVPDIEVTQHDVAFPGVPLGSALGEVSTHMSFNQDRPLDLPKALDSNVKAVKVELRAKTGITNFDFLHALRITMTPKGSDGPPIELIDYEKADGAVVGATLAIPSKNPVNILEQWKTDSATFNVDVAGILPDKTWTIDLSVHFAGKVSYEF